MLTLIMDENFAGIAEIAKLAKVSTSVISNWRKRDQNFPVPISVLQSGPVFEINQIKKYLKRRNVQMATVIACINLKGGVGKTTTTIALAEFLTAEENKKVLVIDLDPQTNATTLLIGEEKWKELNRHGNTIATLFKDAFDPDNPKFELHRTLQKGVSNVSEARDLDLLPSSLDLIEIQDTIAGAPLGKFYAQNPIDILRRGIREIREDYDYILIDCPPNLGIITLNGLRIANGYVIPTIPDYLSTYGISQIYTRVSQFSDTIVEPILPLGVIANMYREQSTVHKNVLKQLSRDKNIPLFKTTIPMGNKISEAADVTVNYQRTIKQKYGGTQFYPLYKQLTEELLTKIENEILVNT